MRIVGFALVACAIAAVSAQAQTDTYVRGLVTGPDGNPVGKITVTAEVCTSQDVQCAVFSAVTDSTDAYVVYLTTHLRGQSVSVKAQDDSGAVPGALPPAAQDLTLTDSLPAVDFQFTREIRSVTIIRVVDQQGVPVQSSLTMALASDDVTPIQLSTDASGACTTLVSPGEWTINVEDAKYLEPVVTYTISSSDTARIAYKVYVADDSITGRISATAPGFDFAGSISITADGLVAADSVRVYGTATINADGSYMVKTLAAATGYHVLARLNAGVQNASITPPEYSGKAPADTGLNFEVLAVDVSVFCNVDISLDDVKSVQIKLIDIVSGRSFVATAAMPNPDLFISVPSGTYTAILTICHVSTNECTDDSVSGVGLGSGQVTFFVSDGGLAVPQELGAAPRATQEALSSTVGFRAASNGTMLQFTAPVAGKARLELFDMKARRIAVLFSGDVQPGTCQVRMERGLLGQGTYLARLSLQGTRSYSATMVVAKTR